MALLNPALRLHFLLMHCLFVSHLTLYSRIVGPFGISLMNTALVKRTPEWLPGAGFRRRTRFYHDLMPTFLSWPFEKAKSTFVSHPYLCADVQ